MATSSRDASRRKSAEIVRNRELLRIARSLLRSKNPEILEGLYTGYIFTAAVCVFKRSLDAVHSFTKETFTSNSRKESSVPARRSRQDRGVHASWLLTNSTSSGRSAEPRDDGGGEKRRERLTFEETYELVLPELLTRAFTFYSGVFT